jgi:hypothetical protein
MGSRLRGRGPRGTILRAARGWGKREILNEVARGIRADGHRLVDLDLSSCAIHPDEFTCHVALACLEAFIPHRSTHVTGMTGPPAPVARLRALAGSGDLEPLGDAGAAVTEILHGLEPRSGTAANLVRLALSLPGRLAAHSRTSVPVVIHNLDATARLSPFPGLREISSLVARSFRPSGIRFVASVSPEGRPGSLVKAAQTALSGDLDLVDVPPMTEEEVGSRRLHAATAGRLLTARTLAAHVSGGTELEEAITLEMDPDRGRLHHELRFDYGILIEKTRGHAASRAILNVLAREDGLDLTGIASRMRRSPGSTLDYLRWLTEVALVRRDGRRYHFTDPLLRLYVLLYETPEHPLDPSGRAVVIRRFLSGLSAPPAPLRPRGRPRGKTGRRRARSGSAAAPQVGEPGKKDAAEDLMEID